MPDEPSLQQLVDRLSSHDDADWEPVDPEVAPADVGAVAADAFVRGDGRGYVCIYEFTDWGAGDAAAEQLRAGRAADEYTAAATQGRFLLFAHVRTDTETGIDDKYALAGLASDLAGRE